METRGPDNFLCGVVLVGSFNVLIFHPVWFYTNDLIREAESDTARIEIIHPDIVSFSLEWLVFEARPDRVAFYTRKESHRTVLRDLVIGTFRLLRHSPINMLGINYDTHTSMPDDWKWEKFQEIFRGEDVPSAFKTSVIKSISLGNKKEYANIKGEHIIRIESSNALPHGMFVGSNHHYVLQQDEPVGAQCAVDTIEEQWESAYNESEEYRKNVIGSYGRFSTSI